MLLRLKQLQIFLLLLLSLSLSLSLSLFLSLPLSLSSSSSSFSTFRRHYVLQTLNPLQPPYQARQSLCYERKASMHACSNQWKDRMSTFYNLKSSFLTIHDKLTQIEVWSSNLSLAITPRSLKTHMPYVSVLASYTSIVSNVKKKKKNSLSLLLLFL